MKWSAIEVTLVPTAVVTVMSTTPDPAGEVAVIFVALLTVNEAAAAAPNLTALAPGNPVPVIVTVVPPEAGPEAGLIDVTAGGLAPT